MPSMPAINHWSCVATIQSEYPVIQAPSREPVANRLQTRSFGRTVVVESLSFPSGPRNPLIVNDLNSTVTPRII